MKNTIVVTGGYGNYSGLIGRGGGNLYCAMKYILKNYWNKKHKSQNNKKLKNK